MHRPSSTSFKSVLSITLILAGLILLALLLAGNERLLSLKDALLDTEVQQMAFVNYFPHSAAADRQVSYALVTRRLEDINGEVGFVGQNYIEVLGMDFEVTRRTVFEGFDTLNDLTEGKEVEVEFSRKDSTYQALRVVLQRQNVLG